MPRSHAVSIGFLTFTLASAAQARGTAAASTTNASETPGPASQHDTLSEPRAHESKEQTDRWMLAVEGAANVPLDLGFEAGLETPFGLRVFGGYGWVVAPYVSWLRGASVSEGSARVVIDEADASGHVLRLKLGIRPFRRLGLYLDAGYGRADLDGALNLTGSVAELGSLSGGYGVHSALDLLLVELGYQVKVENRLILALGLGFTGTLNSSTTITPAGATIGSSSLDVAEAAVDRVFERYGFVPTLNLRVGFNVL